MHVEPSREPFSVQLSPRKRAAPDALSNLSVSDIASRTRPRQDFADFVDAVGWRRSDYENERSGR